MLPYDEAGAGPAVVLLHAGIADRTMWAEHLQPTAGAGFGVIAPELPGLGEAMPSSAPWEDVLATMDELGIEQAALVGNSFGGAVALRVAVVAPERVTALGLVSAPHHDIPPSPQLQAAWQAEESAFERGDIDAAVASVVDTWTLPDAPPELRERVAAMQRRTYELQGDTPEAPQSPDPIEDDPDALHRIAVPTLVAAGDVADDGGTRGGRSVSPARATRSSRAPATSPRSRLPRRSARCCSTSWAVERGLANRRLSAVREPTPAVALRRARGYAQKAHALAGTATANTPSRNRPAAASCSKRARLAYATGCSNRVESTTWVWVRTTPSASRMRSNAASRWAVSSARTWRIALASPATV